MSADNLVRIVKKENGLYRVTHESATSLAHSLNGIEPTSGDLLLSVIANNVSEIEAQKKAEEFVQKLEEDGGQVEYGIVDENWSK